MRLALLLLTAAGLSPAVELQNPPTPLLARVRKIFVDQLGGGATSDQMRDMLIAAIQGSGLYTVTENPDRADAVLKGSADDKIYVDEHQTSDSIGFHGGESSGSSAGASLGTSSSSHRSLSAGITDSESSHTRERRHEAGASVRLVDSEGDVIWSATQESAGGKFRGALAEVADRIARKLAEDTKKARSLAAAPPPARPEKSDDEKPQGND